MLTIIAAAVACGLIGGGTGYLYRKKIAEGNHLLHSFFPQIDLVQIPVRKDKQEDAIFFDVHTPMDLKMAEEQYESIKETEPEAFQPLLETDPIALKKD